MLHKQGAMLRLVSGALVLPFAGGLHVLRYPGQALGEALAAHRAARLQVPVVRLHNPQNFVNELAQ